MHARGRLHLEARAVQRLQHHLVREANVQYQRLALQLRAVTGALVPRALGNDWDGRAAPPMGDATLKIHYMTPAEWILRQLG